MVTQRLKKKPDWLIPERYDFARDLKAFGWQRHLHFRLRSQGLWNTITGLSPEHSDFPDEFSPQFFWESYLKEALRPIPEAIIDPSDSSKSTESPIDSSPVYELEPGEPLPYDFAASTSMRLLAVDLDAADPDIRSAFEHWLKQQPKRPFPRPGRPGFQGTYTCERGKRWHSYRILAILDLSLWCTVFGWRMPSEKKLGDWLNPDYAGQTKSWGDRALEATQQAVDDLARRFKP